MELQIEHPPLMLILFGGIGGSTICPSPIGGGGVGGRVGGRVGGQKQSLIFYLK